MSASKFPIVKSLNNNQLTRFVAYYLELIGFSDIQHDLTKAYIGVVFTAVKNNKRILIRVVTRKEKFDEKTINSLIHFLPLYKADKILLFSINDNNKYISNLVIDKNIDMFSENEIETILSEKFSTCSEFLDYLHDHKIRHYLKFTTREMINEYYRLKNLLGKGYVSGNDVNMHSVFNWMLYKNRFGTWKNFLEEIGEDTDRFKEITAEDLKENFNQIKLKLNKNSLTLEEFKDNSHHGEHLINRHFGSWKNFANEMVGYHSNSSYSDDEIIEEYFRVKQKLGKEVITSTDMNKHAKLTSGVAAWRFGSWTAFLSKIDERQGRREGKDEQDLIDEYHRVKKELNKEIITWTDMLLHSKYSPQKYHYYFGGWKIFSMIMRGEINKNTYTEEELINEYNRVKKELAKDNLCFKDITLHCKFKPYIYKMKFGSLGAFYNKIGEKQICYKEITHEDLKNEYIRVKNIANKKKLYLKEFIRLSNYSFNLYKKYFSSWNNLVKEMGDEIFKNHISEKELIEEYFRIKNEFEKEYISKEFMQKNSNIHVGTYIARYGSWGKFLEYIGEELDYLKAKKIEKKKNSDNEKKKLLITGATNEKRI